MLSSTASSFAVPVPDVLETYLPQQVPDIQVTQFDTNQTQSTYVVKGPGEGSYIRTNQTGVTLLEFMQGAWTLPEIQAAFQAKTKQRISQEKLISFLDLCAKNGLLVHETWRNTVDPELPQQRRISRSVGFYRPVLKGELVINGLYRIRALWWNPLTWGVGIGLIIVGLLFLAFNSSLVNFASPLTMVRPDALSWSIAWLPMLLVLEITFHELAHALACRLVGAKHGGFGFGLLWWVIPVFFTDTGDTYSVTNKYKRAFISAAGPLSDLVWLGVCGAVIWLSEPNTLAYTIAVGYIGIPLSLLLFNLNPFVIRMDGYWIVTHLIEQPNLRRRTLRYFINVIRKALGLQVKLDLLADTSVQQSRWRGLYLGYGVVTLIWTAVFFGLFAWSFAKELVTIFDLYIF